MIIFRKSSKLIIWLIAATLFSCLPLPNSHKDPFIFDFKSGLIVYNYSNSDIDIDDIKKTIECVADFMGADKSLISLLTITITDDEMVYCYDAKRHVACFHRFNNSIAIGGNQRWKMLEHEIKHWCREILTGDADQKHKHSIFNENLYCIE